MRFQSPSNLCFANVDLFASGYGPFVQMSGTKPKVCIASWEPDLYKDATEVELLIFPLPPTAGAQDYLLASADDLFVRMATFCHMCSTRRQDAGVRAPSERFRTLLQARAAA